VPHLVVVTDDEGVQQLICSVASNAGWSTMRAPQITELLAYELDDATLLVLDVAAPCALDDLPALRAERPDLPVLAVADADDPGAAGLGLPVLGLPCTIAELADAIRVAVEPVLDLRDGSRILAG
jgi:DNA-binding response OmpR family regulator